MNRFLIARSALELFGCDYQENAFESTPVTWESQEPRHGLGTRASRPQKCNTPITDNALINDWEPGPVGGMPFPLSSRNRFSAGTLAPCLSLSTQTGRHAFICTRTHNQGREERPQADLT